jgi:hypothetical protein
MSAKSTVWILAKMNVFHMKQVMRTKMGQMYKCLANIYYLLNVKCLLRLAASFCYIAPVNSQTGKIRRKENNNASTNQAMS